VRQGVYCVDKFSKERSMEIKLIGNAKRPHFDRCRPIAQTLTNVLAHNFILKRSERMDKDEVLEALERTGTMRNLPYALLKAKLVQHLVLSSSNYPQFVKTAILKKGCKYSGFEFDSRDDARSWVSATLDRAVMHGQLGDDIGCKTFTTIAWMVACGHSLGANFIDNEFYKKHNDLLDYVFKSDQRHHLDGAGIGFAGLALLTGWAIGIEPDQRGFIVKMRVQLFDGAAFLDGIEEALSNYLTLHAIKSMLFGSSKVKNFDEIMALYEHAVKKSRPYINKYKASGVVDSSYRAIELLNETLENDDYHQALAIILTDFYCNLNMGAFDVEDSAKMIELVGNKKSFIINSRAEKLKTTDDILSDDILKDVFS